MERIRRYQYILFISLAMVTAGLSTTCDNPVNMLSQVERDVMLANNRYLKVESVRALSILADQSVSPGSWIEVAFDKPVDSETLLSKTIVKDSEGDIMILVFDPDAPSTTLRFKPSPYYADNTDYSMSIQGANALDGSMLSDPVIWNFRTGVAPAGFLTLTTQDSGAQAGYARTTIVTAAVNANELATKYILADSVAELEPPPADGPSWLPVAGSASGNWTLPSSAQGTRAVFARFRQYTGSVYVYSDIVTATIVYDNVPPTVNAGSDVWAKASKTLSCTASDATSGVSSYAWSGTGVTFGAQNSVSTTASAASEGAKAVSVTVKDRAGNQAADSLQFTWDTTAPTVNAFVFAGGATYLTTQSTTISTTFSDNFSSATNCQYQIYDNLNGWGLRENAESSTVSHTISFPATDNSVFRYAYIHVYDQAGNDGYALDTVYVDVVPPSVPTITLNVTPYSSQSAATSVTWTWASGGGGNGTFRWEFNDSSPDLNVDTETSSTQSADGEYTLYVQEQDAAGNWSGIGSTLVRLTPVIPYNGALNVARATNLYWRPVTLATGYKLETALSGTGPWTTVYSGSSTGYNPPVNLDASTKYYYRISSEAGKIWTVRYSGSFTTGIR